MRGRDLDTHITRCSRDFADREAQDSMGVIIVGLEMVAKGELVGR
jgi:hypothetical protein